MGSTAGEEASGSGGGVPAEWLSGHFLGHQNFEKEAQATTSWNATGSWADGHMGKGWVMAVVCTHTPVSLPKRGQCVFLLGSRSQSLKGQSQRSGCNQGSGKGLNQVCELPKIQPCHLATRLAASLRIILPNEGPDGDTESSRWFFLWDGLTVP